MTLKKIIALLGIFSMTGVAMGGISDKEAGVFDQAGGPFGKYKLGAIIKNGAKQIEKLVWDQSIDGGVQDEVIKLGELPKHSIVQSVYYIVPDKITGYGNVSFKIGASTSENTGISAYDNLVGLTAIGVNQSTLTVGTPVPQTFATWLQLGESTFDVDMIFSGESVSAGRLILFIEYVVGDEEF